MLFTVNHNCGGHYGIDGKQRFLEFWSEGRRQRVAVVVNGSLTPGFPLAEEVNVAKKKAAAKKAAAPKKAAKKAAPKKKAAKKK